MSMRGLQPNTLHPTEIRFHCQDGSYRTMLTRGVAVRDAAGKPTRFVGISIDITERKRAEEALRVSNERLRIVTMATNDAVWDWNLGTNKVWWNEGVRTLFGYDLEDGEADPEWWLERVHPEDREAVEKDFFDVVHGTELSWVDEYRFRCADGSYKDVYDRGYIVRDADGRATRMIGAILDITERKRAEEALRDSEQRFRTFVDNASDAFLLHAVGEQGRVLDVNRRACESLGYTRDELLGMTPFDFDPDLTPALVEVRARKLNEGETLAFESRHRRKDGTIFPVEVRGKAFGEGGRGFLVTLARDITERKRAEEALRESERRFRTLTEALPHIVWTTEPDGAVDYVNARSTEYTGLTPEQVRGKGGDSAIHPEDLPGSNERWARSITTGEFHENEFRLRRADGAYRWHLARALPLRDDSGRITKWVGFAIDMDDQKCAEEALRQAKEAAEAANRAKDEFLANVSHEIRTPMNAILGMTELALDTPLTGEQREYLASVKSSAEALLKVINDLLDFAKIEAGKLELDHADFSLRHVLGESLRALALRAHRKGLEPGSTHEKTPYLLPFS